MKQEKQELIKSVEDAYAYFLREKNGYVKSFKMDSAMLADFCNVGYIKMGVNGDLQERWQITDFGKSQFRAYLALAKQKKKADTFMASLNKGEEKKRKRQVFLSLPWTKKKI